MITLDAVEKTYQSHRSVIPALKGISLAVEQGEIYGIIGKKGAGKTTLLRCIALLERPSQGTIVVDHFSHSHLKGNALNFARRSIGLVTQETYLLESRTVFENIALPLELVDTPTAEIASAVKPLLSLVGMTDKANNYPRDLSQAEKKRVALATALVYKPKILLCDDPTADVEAKSTYALLQLLKEINERFKISILICTQEIDVIKTICHRVAILQKGEIIEETNTISLFAKPKSTLAKEWVKASTRLELPTALRRRLKPVACENSNPVLRLSFTTSASHEALIAHIVQHFYLTINIMQAHIEQLRDESIAIMIVEVKDEHNSLDSAIAFLESQALFVEVLGYATSSH
jgi:D-methionine transport system ATP-binding protein